MGRHRLFFAIAITLLFLFAGLYLSGYATLTLLGLGTERLQWNSYLIYYRALDLPAVAPYAAKIKWGGGLGFGLCGTFWLGGLVLALKPRPKSAHGEARFAGRSELARHGLLKPAPDGIVIGKIGNTLIRLPGQQFALLAAPTRSGKGVGIVIPNLLEYRDSIVVLDIKGENFELTSGWRAEQGQKIYKFNPYDTHTHRWNPMGYVASDPHKRINDIQAIAAMLYPDQGGEDKFWVSQSRNAFLAFALYLYENYDDQREQGFPPSLQRFPTLGAILRLACGDGRNLKDYLTGLAEARFLSASAKVAFAGLLSQEKETFASIMGTLREPLNPFVSPIMDAATSGNDFRLNEVRKKPMTIYLVIPPHKLGECRVLVNLFFSQLINENTQQLPLQNPALKHQCLLLMDEFTAIGRVDKLAESITHMAGYNLRVFPIIQSKAQLESAYGKEVARTFITNHAVQIVFAPREQQDANDYSEMLGYTTVKRQSVTRGRDYSRNESEERRALMLPQELKALGPDKQIVFYEGLAQPVLCEKIKYYSDKEFKARVKPPVKILTAKV
ncbi:MAG TPA: type IV secretory system conjugative DNA transfer family protein [Luteimonas sp.]|nr:type IV secretory system conjugative DNA transfer family protein [Luteimonas sp.]